MSSDGERLATEKANGRPDGIPLGRDDRFDFFDLGFGPYEDLFGLVRESHGIRADGGGRDTIFFAEHEPVYTLGKRPTALDCFFDREGAASGRLADVPVVRTDRGGLATYHGPGQLMVYPVVALKPGEQAVRRLVGALETLAGLVAEEFGVESFSRDDAPGRWTEAGKLAAIGLSVQRLVTLHGMGFNVCADLEAYRVMDPCGIRGGDPANLNDLAGCEIAVSEVRDLMVRLWPKAWR